MDIPPIYFDNHATTRVDPRVVEAMTPYFTELYGNASSATHEFGWDAKRAVEKARESIAAAVGAKPKEIIFTSGATESNNLAIRGSAGKVRKPRAHFISVASEHPSVLDPLEKLRLDGHNVTLLPIAQAPDDQAGRIQPDQLAEVICDDTVLVSVMAANNEIGVIQPLVDIAPICKERGILFHTDTTQAIGKIPIDVERMGIDLMSFSSHKLYGPKGIGAIYVRRRHPMIQLEPLIFGGGHESGMRSGTLNVPGIVGFARAVELCLDEMTEETERLRTLRDRLHEGLLSSIPGLKLNGPKLSQTDLRLSGNLNVAFPGIDGEALLMSVRNVAASTGSACSSSQSETSSVLRALGLSEELSRGSIRFGLGRFNTLEEVDTAIESLVNAVDRLNKMSSVK